jgi:hypothetical protein
VRELFQSATGCGHAAPSPRGERSRTKRERFRSRSRLGWGAIDSGPVRPGKDEFGLRLAAKAADREQAARREWPALEERLRGLGYGPRAIAHAFSTLSGPGTVAEALEVPKDVSRPASHPIALVFEVIESRGGASVTDGVMITAVERDERGIRVTYDAVPPLGFGSRGPRGEARDDLGNDHDGLAGHFRRALGGWRGGLTVRLPPPAATVLRVRITWDASCSSIWEGPAHEVRVSLLE